MKLHVMAAAGVAGLLATAGVAYSQGTAQPQTSQYSVPQQSAAPGTTQMRDESMGGTPTTKGQWGARSRYMAPCPVGLSCDIYKGS
jgi:hypothetical protein